MGQVNINSVEVKKSFLETILRSKIFWIFLIITVWFCAAFFIDPIIAIPVSLFMWPAGFLFFLFGDGALEGSAGPGQVDLYWFKLSIFLVLSLLFAIAYPFLIRSFNKTESKFLKPSYLVGFYVIFIPASLMGGVTAMSLLTWGFFWTFKNNIKNITSKKLFIISAVFIFLLILILTGCSQIDYSYLHGSM